MRYVGSELHVAASQAGSCGIRIFLRSVPAIGGVLNFEETHHTSPPVSARASFQTGSLSQSGMKPPFAVTAIIFAAKSAAD